jgi:hypothetical protein
VPRLVKIFSLNLLNSIALFIFSWCVTHIYTIPPIVLTGKFMQTCKIYEKCIFQCTIHCLLINCYIILQTTSENIDNK